MTTAADDGGRVGIRSGRVQCGELTVGHFQCVPSATAWNEENCIGPGTLLVIPRHTVEIAQAARETIIASPAQAVFYRSRQLYRRRLIDPRGDNCVFIRLPDQTWDRLLELPLGTVAEDGLPFCRGPIRPRTFHAFDVFTRRLHGGELHDPLAVEEALLPLVGMLVDAARDTNSSRHRPRTAHVDLGVAAERFVASHFAQGWSLDELAATLEVSPAHLARVFRRHTGMSLHQQRVRLRICAALDRLADPQQSLTELALELGFSTPSHFSDAFRRTIGIPPSAVRGAGLRRRDSLRASVPQ